MPFARNLFVAMAAKAPAIIRIQASPAVRDWFNMVYFIPWITANLTGPFVPVLNPGH